jgi:DNA-directed RNA polymerase subunit M/transcription elongation factor TFIIS
MFCDECGSIMIPASSSRGIQTYKCKAGCDCYTFIYTEDAPTPEPTKVQVREFAYA